MKRYIKAYTVTYPIDNEDIQSLTYDELYDFWCKCHSDRNNASFGNYIDKDVVPNCLIPLDNANQLEPFDTLVAYDSTFKCYRMFQCDRRTPYDKCFDATGSGYEITKHLVIKRGESYYSPVYILSR